MYKYLLQNSYENKIKLRPFIIHKLNITTNSYKNNPNNNNNKRNFIITMILGFYFIHLKNR